MRIAKHELVAALSLRYDHYSATTMFDAARSQAELADKPDYDAAEIAAFRTALARIGDRLDRVNARLDLLTLSISIDNFAAGFAGSALIAYMSGLTSPAFAATQYALLSSLYALPGKFVGGFSGAVVDTYGYPVLFTATATIGIPLVILCFVVRRDTLAVDAKEDAGSGGRRGAAGGVAVVGLATSPNRRNP